MGQAQLAQLADELLNDQDLRELFTKDPEAAAQKAGIALDEDDRQALENLDVQGMNDEELVARISKRGARLS